LLDRGAAGDVPADGGGDEHDGRVVLLGGFDARGLPHVGAGGAVDEVDGQVDLASTDAAVLVDVVDEGGDGDRHVAEIGSQAGLGQRGEVGADERQVDGVVGDAGDGRASVGGGVTAPVVTATAAVVGGLAAAGSGQQYEGHQPCGPSVSRHASPRRPS